MSAAPALATVDGRLSFADAGRVLVVDPGVALLEALVDTWIDTVQPGAVDGDAGNVDCDERPLAPGEVPTLSVLARKPVLDEAFDEFHARSRASGLAERDRLSLSVLDEHQPNALLVVDGDPVAVVDAGDRWIPVGEPAASPASGLSGTASRSLDYAEHLERAEAYALRTPSRRSLRLAFAARCGESVASDLLALLDATPTVRRHDPCDQLVRAYLVGARHGVVNYDLRRASEDCGLASPSTLSTVKAALEADGLLETEPVPQPRGRPRQRLVVGVGELETASLETMPALVRELRAERGE